MTINDVQYSWIPSVHSDNDRYATHSEAAEGLSAVDIWIQPWPTAEDLRICWGAYQERLADEVVGLTHFLIHTESIAGKSRTRIHQLRKNIAQMILPASMSKFIDSNGVLTYECDGDFIASAMPVLKDAPLCSFDDFLRRARGFYLIAIERDNINLLQSLIETKARAPSASITYDFPDVLFDFFRNHPAIGLYALGCFDDRDKSVLAIGNERTLKRFMNI